MVSVPQKQQNIQGFQEKIHGIEIDPKFRDLLDPDINKLNKEKEEIKRA